VTFAEEYDKFIKHYQETLKHRRLIRFLIGSCMDFSYVTTPPTSPKEEAVTVKRD
jgi:hypothetical protein